MKTVLWIAGPIGVDAIISSLPAQVAGLIGVITIFGFMTFLVMVVFRLVQ
jgi:hypothetical protein